MENGKILIASAFAGSYFGLQCDALDSGYFDLTSWCESEEGYTLQTDQATGVSLCMPATESAFSAEDFQRMLAFFDNKYIPEPRVNVEQSRTVIAESGKQDVENCLNWKNASYDSFYDPAILAVKEAAGTSLYAAYSRMPYVDGVRTSKGTDFVVSHDMGKNWELLKTFPQLTAASTIVEIDGVLYVLGGFSQAQIAKYDPVTGKDAFAVFPFDVGYSGPGTPLIDKGRLYKPYGERILSIDISKDLMDGANWIQSNAVSDLLTPQWFREQGLNGHGYTINGTHVDWEEGNIVLGKDGKLYVIYRQNIARGHAVILALSDDGKTLSYVNQVNGAWLEKPSIIEIPAAQSRHTIRYDPDTGLYLCMMNTYTGDAKTQYAWTDKQQRSVLSLTASSDLVNWEIREIMLVDRKMMNPVLSVFAHGYQYADFAVADGNVYFVVRENSGEKTFNYHHEANYITMYTIQDYRKLLMGD